MQPEPETAEIGELRAARQQLTEEMRRLLANYRPPPKDTTVGGIPVDSEYIIFVIDTSGSMFSPLALRAQAKVTETLDVYPKVKGIQVMNDEGKYMFSSYAGKWIPDSPASRAQRSCRHAGQLEPGTATPDPVEGIAEAINTFYEPGKRISVYVFGDDFPRGRSEARDPLRRAHQQGRTDRATAWCGSTASAFRPRSPAGAGQCAALRQPHADAVRAQRRHVRGART